MALLLDYLVKFLLGYAALTISLYMASLAVPKAGFAARVLAAYISLLACAVYGVLASILLALVGKRQIAQWACGRAFDFTMRYTTGVEFVIDDPDNVLGSTRPAVFIGNHQTELDVLMLGAIFPKYCSVTAKAQLKRVPFLGWFMSLSGTIFIDRKNSQGARSAMDGAANEIKTSRQSVYMFPEGTRSYAKEPMLLPFKKGAFHLAVQSGVPIVPVVVANYSHVLYVKNLVFNSGKIPVKVLAPIPTTNLTTADVDELTRSTREVMLSELISLTEKARGHPIAVPATNGSSTGKSTAVDK
ncbi:probable 1-acyl-sn-glycerol-3-phosphate acyltransferase [Trichoderma asperellum]|uniref:1-acyl-sn-glycerol-3-phosphate acyltransferase n=1 Tax=Trichoderma asperellum TaxID=101201 RepID=A0A6V8QHT4_TRIAP|nr:acyltransferase-domain-containing protein [Trichoderma asperelloides]GFP52034.1 probable 1-acyl-sn-glycerol-3-phosphate acyltransferase [Trichoderma asperellum]